MNDATPVLLTSLSCHPLARGTSGPGSRPSLREPDVTREDERDVRHAVPAASLVPPRHSLTLPAPTSPIPPRYAFRSSLPLVVPPVAARRMGEVVCGRLGELDRRRDTSGVCKRRETHRSFRSYHLTSHSCHSLSVASCLGSLPSPLNTRRRRE